MHTSLDCGLSLRPANPDDLPYIADCIRESVLDSVTEDEREMADLWCDTTVATALESLSSRRMEDEVFILTDENESKGMLWMGVSRDQFNSEPVGYLLGIYVSKEIRGKGIGKQLLRSAESWCRDRDLLTMQLNVGAYNLSAKHLYEAAGYGERSKILSKVLKR